MATPQSYILGHNDRERRRLAIQASVLRPITERFFEDAGISAGMKVLDLGCGVGDVSMILSRMVGAEGKVTGLDFDPAAVAAARQRTAEAGVTNTVFVESNVADWQADVQMDAVAGRHILIHTPDPVAILRRAADFMRPGGILAFQEYDFSLWVPSWPESALNSRIMRVFVELFPKLTHANAGSRLHHWYRQAGFPAPRVSGNVLTDGAPGSPYYEWMVESLRAILPRAEQMGLVQPGEFDLDLIADQLRAELLAAESTVAGIIMMGAYSNKPASIPLNKPGA
jgi:ubiquinone/menaquinone biosynthesis C-methylase UbiE